MNNHWDDETPIYKQLVQKLKKAIINHVYDEGCALPSVRAISAELNINHITVSKSYHELLDQGLIEKKRGIGMFVKQGAIAELTLAEQNIFMNEDLPKLISKMKQLDISSEKVIQLIKKSEEMK